MTLSYATNTLENLTFNFSRYTNYRVLLDIDRLGILPPCNKENRLNHHTFTLLHKKTTHVINANFLPRVN